MRETVRTVYRLIESKADEYALEYVKSQKILTGHYPSVEEFMKVKQQCMEKLVSEVIKELNQLVNNKEV